MRSLIVGLVAFFAMAGSASAGLIELDFKVDNLRAKGGAPDSNLAPFNYKIVLDTSTARSTYFTTTYGLNQGGIWFDQADITESAVSGTVLDHVAAYGLKPSPLGVLDRQYQAGGTSANPSVTWQSIAFLTYTNSPYVNDPLYPGMLTSTGYQRGIQRQGSVGDSNTVMEFNTNTFVDYMSSLIGDKTFEFWDGSLVSSFDPATYSGRTESEYSYYGQATLTSVTAFPGSNNSVNAVPEPSSFALFLLGLLLIVSTRWKRIVSRLKVHILRSAAMTTQQHGSLVGARMTTT